MFLSCDDSMTVKHYPGPCAIQIGNSPSSTGNFIYDSNDTVNEAVWGDSHTAFYYDNSGRLEREETDENGDGSIDEQRTYSYNENSLEITVDTSLDGIIDRRDTHSYNPSSKCLNWPVGVFSAPSKNQSNCSPLPYLVELDLNNDGIVDQSYENPDYIFDEKGRLVKEVWRSLESNEISFTYTYDDNDNVLTRGFDSGNDGTVDELSVYTYSCWK